MDLPDQKQVAAGLLKAVESQYSAQFDTANANIMNLLSNTAGIDDHAKITDALKALIEEQQFANDHLECIQHLKLQLGISEPGPKGTTKGATETVIIEDSSDD